MFENFSDYKFLCIPRYNNSLFFDILDNLPNRTLFYKKNQVITNVGENLQDIYYLKEGVTISSILSLSGHIKTVFISKAPCLFNEGPTFSSTQTNMEIKSLQRCEIRLLSRSSFFDSLSSNIIFRDSLIESLALKSCALVNQISYKNSLSTSQFVQHILHELALEFAHVSTEGIYLEISQDDLAEICGLHRVTIAKAYRDLKETNFIINSKKNKLYLNSSILNYIK